jgi:hypothetical protein
VRSPRLAAPFVHRNARPRKRVSAATTISEVLSKRRSRRGFRLTELARMLDSGTLTNVYISICWGYNLANNKLIIAVNNKMSNPTGIGGFKPGEAGNPNGRPPGSRNKRTHLIIQQIIKSGGKDPLVRLSELVTSSQDESIAAASKPWSRAHQPLSRCVSPVASRAIYVPRASAGATAPAKDSFDPRQSHASTNKEPDQT